MTLGVSTCLSVPSQLLIVLIDTIHGVLVGLLDLGDDPALGLPVADSQLLVSKPCTPPQGAQTRSGMRKKAKTKQEKRSHRWEGFWRLTPVS